MGYGFICNKRKDDEDEVFYTSCMYAYQPIFRECFGKEITDFKGRVTKDKAKEFRNGVDKFVNCPNKYNLNNQQMRGYVDNCTYEDLLKDLYIICNLMDSKEVEYIYIS